MTRVARINLRGRSGYLNSLSEEDISAQPGQQDPVPSTERLLLRIVRLEVSSRNSRWC